jgi:primosomal protein N' (replication factor Y)
MTNRVRVLVLNSAIGVLDYCVPKGIEATFGSIVLAPLGPRKISGIIWEPERLKTEEVEAHKLRPILEISQSPPIPAPLRRLIEWTSDYYCTSMSSVARMVFSPKIAFSSTLSSTEYSLTNKRTARLTNQRRKALTTLEGKQGSIRELSRITGVSEGVLRGMVNIGLLKPQLVDQDQDYPKCDPYFDPPSLSAHQGKVSEQLVLAVKSNRFSPFLLDGVTGSGKTETYFEPMSIALKQEQQVLVLLPEIALTEGFLRRFKQRFGADPVLWHSSLKASEKRRAWHAISKGTAQVIVGARSALFLPYQNLGLIIVDEAHEVSFKQDDGVRYNARDVAVMRAQFEEIPIVLASATPALESMQMAKSGVYKLLSLPERYGGACLPKIEIIDLTKNGPQRKKWIAPQLVSKIEDRLAKGEQSLLFLNRRGYAPLTLCRNCGFRFQCTNCSAWLVEHRLSQKLSCHHCGYAENSPEKCPDCGEPDCLVACGPGVERIADEISEIFPEAKVSVATSDTLNSPQKAADFIVAAETGAINIIIGTQLVTKGFHFPNLTLVGVLDADLGLEGGDLRAGERTYQQISQAAGRAGRGAKSGEVFIQTRHPDAAVIAALAKGDREAFYNAETEARRNIGAPPFGRWAAIIISSENDNEARSAALELGNSRPKITEFSVLGPAPAPLALLRGRYRYRFLINARRSSSLQKIIMEWISGHNFAPGVRLGIDIDPYSFV